MSEYPTHLIRRIRHKAFGTEERIVLFVLADRMQKTTDVVWPSVETVASDCGMSERGVRYVIGWLVSVGVLVEVDDGRRTRSFRIDFDRLACLPDSVLSRSRKETYRHPVPPTMHPVHLDRHGAQDALTGTTCTQGGTGEQADRHPVPLRPAPGAPEGIREGTKKEPVKEPIPATVPARVEGSSGQRLAFFFANPDPSTPATIPATPTARPEPSKALVESLPVYDSNPPPKGKGKASKKPSGKLTESQAKAHTAAIDCWHETFIEYKNEKPIITGKDIKDIDALLGVMQWDIDKTCALIKSAFTHVWFREKNCSIAELVKKPSTYQVPVQSERRSFGQVEPGEDFWANRDNDLAEDYGS